MCYKRNTWVLCSTLTCCLCFFFVYSQQIFFEWRHLDYRGYPGCCRPIESTSSYNFLKKIKTENIICSYLILYCWLAKQTNKKRLNFVINKSCKNIFLYERLIDVLTVVRVYLKSENISHEYILRYAIFCFSVSYTDHWEGVCEVACDDTGLDKLSSWPRNGL